MRASQRCAAAILLTHSLAPRRLVADPPDRRRPAVWVGAERRALPAEPARVALRVYDHATVPFALFRVRAPTDFTRELSGGPPSFERGALGREMERLLAGTSPSPRVGRLVDLVSQRSVDLAEMTAGDGWRAASVDLGALSTGLYLARVTVGGWAATAVVPVSDLVLLARRGDRGDRVFVTDASGVARQGVRVERTVRGSQRDEAVTNAQGTAAFPASEALDATFVASVGADTAHTSVRHAQETACDVRVYLDTGRGTFFRGDVMNLRGHVRGCVGERELPLADETVALRAALDDPPRLVRTDRDGNFTAVMPAGCVRAQLRGRDHVRCVSLAMPSPHGDDPTPPPTVPGPGLSPQPLPAPPAPPSLRVEMVTPQVALGDDAEFILDAPAAGAVVVTVEQAGVLAWTTARGPGPTRLSLPTRGATRGDAAVVATHAQGGSATTVSSRFWIGTSPSLVLRVATYARVARGARLPVSVEVRTSQGEPRGPVLSLWMNDARWWDGDRSVRLPPAEYLRPPGRSTDIGDSTLPPDPASDEGRRHDPLIAWNGRRIDSFTFRHAWASREANVSVNVRGEFSHVAREFAVASGHTGAEVCVERERELGAVQLRVRDAPWDLVAERIATLTNTILMRHDGLLEFGCGGDSGRSYGSGVGRGLRSRGLNGPTMRLAPNELALPREVEGFVGLRRVGGGGGTIDLTAPSRAGRWRVEVLAIDDDGSAAAGHADVETY